MAARRSVWSDPEVQRRLARFVPAADEVHRLQSRKDPDCLLFQEIAEQGHFGGRTKPTNTRQGIYATTVTGRLLASINTRNAERVAKMLDEAWAAWSQLSPEQRSAREPLGERTGGARWLADAYPERGLALKTYTRDLERERQFEDWRDGVWNADYAWFRENESRGLIPEELAVGARCSAPPHVVQRLARHHLVDNVRGQVRPFRKQDVRLAELESEILAVDARFVTLRLRGRTHTEVEGRWPINGYKDMNAPTEQSRGYRAQLLGDAIYDRSTKRFLFFELLAVGTRWGGTQYNGRGDDLEPAPMGVLLTLAEPEERVPPAFLWDYEWQ